MSIASIITRGYIDGVNFIPTRGYSSSSMLPVLIDTHDGLPRKFYLPIYEYTRKHKKIERIIKVEQAVEESSAADLPPIPFKAVEWDNSAVHAFAKSTMQSIENVEHQIEAIKKHEVMLDEDEDDLLMMALTIH